MIADLTVIIGTQEEFVMGYKVEYTKKKNLSLVMDFANYSQRGSIRCLATIGHFVLSGGTGRDIHLYNLKTRTDSGSLEYHNGPVSCMEFTPNFSHLVSGSENGGVAMCRTGRWRLEKLWGAAHKDSAVTSLSVHPSGKLALSVGKDGRLCTWNLVKGRLAFAARLSRDEFQHLTSVKWSPSGDKYAVVLESDVFVYDTETAGLIYTVKSNKEPPCIYFLSDEIMFVGDEGGMLTIHNLPRQMKVQEVKIHEGPVKCLDRIQTWLVTASSAGTIKIWNLQDETTLSEICCMSTGCKITCLALLSRKLPNPVKEKETVQAKRPPVKPVKRKTGIVGQLSDDESPPVKKQSHTKRAPRKETQKKQKPSV